MPYSGPLHNFTERRRRVPTALFAQELFSVSRRGGGVGRAPEDEAMAGHWAIGAVRGNGRPAQGEALAVHIGGGSWTATLLFCLAWPTTSCTNIYYQAVSLSLLV